MDKELTLVEHLDELRRRIIVSLAAVGLASLVTLPVAPALLRFLKAPAEGAIGKLAFFGPQDAFLIYMKVGFLAGLVLAFPVVIYQLWLFVSPALDERLKRNATLFVTICTLAFLAGVAFAYLVLLPASLRFLLTFGTDDLQPVISADSYLSFIMGMILACGAVFEMPVLSFLLTRLGIVNASMLRSNLKFAVVGIFVVSAIITPTTDIFNMTALALPMLLLYAVSIWVSALAGKRTRALSS